MTLNFQHLTDEQVYALSENTGLSKTFRKKAKAELSRRGKPTEHSESLLLILSQSAVSKKRPLPPAIRLALMAFPAFVVNFPLILVIEIVLLAIFLPMTIPWQWKQFWGYTTAGLIIWTIGIYLFHLGD